MQFISFTKSARTATKSPPMIQGFYRLTIQTGKSSTAIQVRRKKKKLTREERRIQTDVPTTGTPTPMPSTASPTPNPTVDNLVDTVTDTTESGENNEGGEEDGGEDESSSATKSYYSCSTDTVSTSNSSDDATKLILAYDYELHTTSPFSEDTLLNFENNMAQDLADKYGLITCDERKKKKRNLRGLQSSDEEEGGVLLALASDPVDEAKNCK